MFCYLCGRKNNTTANFCRWCGEDIAYGNHTPNIQSKKTPSVVRNSTYAPFFVRLLAFIADVFIVLYTGVTLYLLWSIVVHPILLFLFYNIFFLSVYSSTPGKVLFGLKVINEETGEEIVVKTAIKRTLSYFISFIPLGLGFIAILTDKKRCQSWHDQIARTVVSRKRDKSIIIPSLISLLLVVVFLLLYFSDDDVYEGLEYLGRDSAIIHTADKHLREQDPLICCMVARPEQISSYKKEVPTNFPRIASLSPSEIYQEFDKLSVVIKTDTGSLGSGFNISPSGMIVTNHHVIKGASKIVVVFVNNRNIEVYDVNLIIAQSEQHDIAVLKIDGGNLPFAMLGDSNNIFPGEYIYAIGNPAGYHNTISDGIVSQLRTIGDVDFLQITAPISAGSSGGPVINTRGEVVAITTNFFIGGQSINFAVTINQLKELLGVSI